MKIFEILLSFIKRNQDKKLVEISRILVKNSTRQMFGLNIGVLAGKRSLIRKRRARIATIIMFIFIISFQIQVYYDKSM